MSIQGRYIDPATHSYVVEEGNYKRIPAGLGRAHNLVVLAGGSVPDAPQFKCRLRSVGSMRPGVTAEVEAMIDEALRPHVGILFRGYTRRAWVESGNRLVHEITVDGDESGNIPVTG